jgi:His/Glu/Gln/Arg/opine family amino acid ABC transporter permease subunit
MFSNFDYDVIIRSLPYLFYDGMTFTLALTAFATVGGIIFGTLLAMMRLSGFVPISVLAAGYVNLMRSVPLLLVIFWFYFLVPYIGQWITGASRPVEVGAFVSSFVTFTLFEAAYFAEIMRAGIQSIPRGQVSAAQALGMTAAGVPQHGAGAAHPDHHPVPGHLPRLRALDHGFPRRSVQSGAARRAAGGDVLVRRIGLFRDLVHGFAAGAPAAEAGRDHPLRTSCAYRKFDSAKHEADTR